MASTEKTVGKGRSKVLTWEDDPESTDNCQPVAVPAPSFPGTGLTITIHEPERRKPGKHREGSDDFRYWVACEALCRGLKFWRVIFSSERLEAKWQRGGGRDPSLPVRLNELVELNAYYDRTRLDFGHKVSN